jgi:2-iminobutanoate/2-iminopropanoate deaminase
MSFDRLIFVSGQGATTDPATGQLAGPDVPAQTEQCLKNLRAILQAAGSDLQHVLRLRRVPARHDGVPADERRLRARLRRPSPGADDDSGRGTAGRGLRVEIDCIAYRP